MPSFHLHGRSLLSSSLSIFHLSFSLLRHLPSSTFSFRANQNNPRFLSSKETPVITHAVTPLFMSPLVYLPSIPLPLIPFPLSRHSAKPYFPIFFSDFFFFLSSIYSLSIFPLSLSLSIYHPSLSSPFCIPSPRLLIPPLLPPTPYPLFPFFSPSLHPPPPPSFPPSPIPSGLALHPVLSRTGRVGSGYL